MKYYGVFYLMAFINVEYYGVCVCFDNNITFDSRTNNITSSFRVKILIIIRVSYSVLGNFFSAFAGE